MNKPRRLVLLLLIYITIYITILTLGTTVILLFFPKKTQVFTIPMSIGRTHLLVELALSGLEQEKGLSGRASLAPGGGMLFTYLRDKRPSFWMKDMRIPLDFVWINNDTVVELEPNVPIVHNGSLPIYQPTQDADMVLELPLGSIRAYNLQRGDKVNVDHNLIYREYLKRTSSQLPN